MCDETLVKQLLEENKNLKEEVNSLKNLVHVLERRLKLYENPHTPPSKKQFSSKKPKSNGRPGQKKGHEGTTRPVAQPDRTIVLTACKCPKCKSKNLRLKAERRTITEDIPNMQQKTVTEFIQWIYECIDCGAEIITTHPELPKEGRFGKNIISQVTLMKYADRLPHRKIRNSLNRQYDIDLSAATILDLTRRASNVMRPEYERILKRIRKSKVVHSDETGMKVNGKKCWTWVFVSGNNVIVVVADSRGKKVIERTLGKDFREIIVCDGWKSYSSFTNRVQRCWAHLLREADDIASHHEEAKGIADELHSIFNDCKELLKGNPPPDQRKKIQEVMNTRMKRVISTKYEEKEVKGFIKKITNGFNYWFTFVLYPYVEPTNNIAERALRENVIQRKIIGTLRNGKGIYIYETAMSVIPTWENMGLNPFEELVRIL